MKSKRRIGLSILSLFMMSLYFFSPLSVYAKDGDGYSIFVQKYKLDDSTVLSKELPQDGSKAEIVTDTKGKALAPLAGVHYEVVRVTPLSEGTGFQVVEGVEAFSTTLTTDSTGQAHITGLAQGMYRVTEKPKEGLLKNIMEPVILELPLPQPNGKAALSEVYLYPKSSVVTAKDIIEKENGRKNQATRLPQTSGNIGDYNPFVWISLLILSMGLIGLVSMKRKKFPH
ncbi:hypothetical protein IGI37_003734 [Enterococcus sp. AZ194]|uniref:pilin N-terminal domain-containing protein n=1 Tax=Enterococcus sp. AZ194 TaxID=2774629 RepID=UPI003F28CC1E